MRISHFFCFLSIAAGGVAAPALAHAGEQEPPSIISYGVNGFWTGAQVGLNNTAILSNAPSGTFDLQADGTSFALNSGTPLLANSGTFRKTSGTGVTTITTPFNNAEIVTA